MNILFVMYDQLRWDYLSCAGHPHLKTPNFDRLASMGMMFDRTYVQSPICGSSRMSTYTGRYVDSHGASWNGVPLRVGELTLGDHLRPLGMETWLIGKTHMRADTAGMERLGIAKDGIIGARVSECGFDPWVRDDGLWAKGENGFYDKGPQPYNDYLRSKGYDSDNPWHDFANAGVTHDDQIASGWFMANANLPANIAEEDSETAWLTDQALTFLRAKKGQRWCAHLSYIKPHWPYIVPAPYHDAFGPEHVIPPVREDAELHTPHPIYGAFANGPVARAFQNDQTRENAIRAYMGLIKQCDDHFGRVLAYLEDTGEIDNTMIVLTSDHGDYLGDHWLGEKNLFHDCSAKVPLIIYDPRREANAARGTRCDALVEQIDLVATFIDAAGGEVPKHIVEGRSLQPFLHGEARCNWRDAAISEYDFSQMPPAAKMGLTPADSRIIMVASKTWKLWHFEGGLPPMLFHLESDPDELSDRAKDPDCADALAHMYGHLHAWALRQSQRVTKSDAEIEANRGNSAAQGIYLGVFEASELPPLARARLSGPAPKRPKS